MDDVNGIICLLEGIQQNGLLEVEVKKNYPNVGECTLIVSSNDKPTQSVTWQLGSSSSIIDDTKIDTGFVWSSAKVAAELLKKINSPELAGSAGMVLTLDTDGTTPVWKVASGGVSSVNGKTGTVILDGKDIVTDSTAAGAPTITSALNTLTTTVAGKANIGDSYTKAEDDALLLAKANNADVYNKTETYNKTEIDAALSAKSNIGDSYTKTEDNALLALKSNVGDSYLKAEVYNKTEVDTELGKKIDKPATTVAAGYIPKSNAAGDVTWAAESVTSVNTKTGAVILAASDINTTGGDTIEVALGKKLDYNSSAAVDTVPTKTSTGWEWKALPAIKVNSVNGKDGDVVLAAGDIKMADGTTTVEAGINNKMDKPSDAATTNYAPIIASDGKAHWAAIANSVNGKNGAITLTGSDITVSSTDTTKIDAALAATTIGAKIGGTDLTVTDRKIIIPVAGTSAANTAGTLGVVGVDEAEGINVNGYGTLQFNNKALNKIGAAHTSVTAEEYDSSKMYYVGDYVTYEGRMYVCKAMTTGLFTTGAFKFTNESKEINNLLSQLIAALGLQESSPRTWNSTDEKIEYHFDIV